ncbi:DNA polymerase III subunit chi [Bordetella avium]|uniref:DNA polymerase III, chi subunit n=1 Tax=Bordetella avium (strain 197N) TaxID=360910 RepID=Q2KWX2_BORA1|nr:DNA polymerase III subunit chi [Bordetella avium]AZY48631.1 DNA polymerase III subunit chi [Bordetella avium]AZY52011.1 DNA polymerase III subunit chi [Bordetella avium]RIQ13938.1 DNA polymerase III subunit chi [Bordetella avium]RIQ16987.1 DNA polymerase III subunit chi [Bordetella avium]RIQ36286.1 DNA polymerase III subunit chi [Bordetella avium]
MTRIDFAFGAADRLRAACQTARKRYLAGQRLIVYCSDANRLSAFDRLLWAFDDISFVPHVLARDALAAHTPIVLTATNPQQAAALAPDAWLLNLDDACPPHYDDFPRVLEIVSGNDTDRAAARVRWRDYVAAGHTPHSHDLSRSA